MLSDVLRHVEIKDNQIRHFLQLINYFQHITGPEAAVIQFIQCRIFSRCLNRFLDDLDADHFFCYRCRDLGDGACSAVQVKDNFILRISDIFPCCLVQYLGPQRIGLEEGEWCNLEFQSQKFLIKIVLSIQNFCSFIFYRISQAVVLVCRIPAKVPFSGNASSASFHPLSRASSPV